ncbi:MAG: hypothetical protein FWF24_04915 [Alphaproteobacteria bacterium]|nr:hypothetical protein [Alphaproteobacteria bacterium]
MLNTGLIEMTRLIPSLWEFDIWNLEMTTPPARLDPVASIVEGDGAGVYRGRPEYFVFPLPDGENFAILPLSGAKPDSGKEAYYYDKGSYLRHDHRLYLLIKQEPDKFHKITLGDTYNMDGAFLSDEHKKYLKEPLEARWEQYQAELRDNKDWEEAQAAKWAEYRRGLPKPGLT